MGKDRWRTGRGWGRRLAIGLALLVAGAAALFFTAVGTANNRFEAKIRTYQAAGTPIHPEDFIQEPVPDAENGALVYTRAGDAITAALADDQGRAFQKDFDGEYPLTDAQRELIRAAVARCEEPLRLLRTVRGMVRMSWDIKFLTPVSQTFASTAHQQRLSAMRQIANLLRAAALDAFDRGDHATGIEYLLDVTALARATDRMPPTLITHMTANGIDAVAAETALDVATDLPASAAGPMRELVTALFDTLPRKVGMLAAWDGERMVQADAVRYLAAQAPIAGMLIKLDGVRMLEMTDQVRGAAEQPTYPGAMSLIPSIQSGRGLARFMRPLSRALVPTFSRTLETEAKATVLRRATAIVLALRLYTLDHDGKLPPALIELVPRYLPLVPSDPFTPGNGPFLYVPTGETPKLYSVGQNGFDDGGSEKSILQPARSRWDSVDFVFPLTRQPKPTTQEVD